MSNNPRQISISDFPEKEGLEAQIKFVLNYAILAPSTHSNQISTFKDKNIWQPIEIASSQLDAFIKQHPGILVVDEARRNLEEIFLLRNPKYRFDKIIRKKN